MPSKRGRKPKEAIDLTWRPELAYCVGLIASDGCLSGDGRHVTFVSKDWQLIQTFLQCLEIQTPVKSKRGGFGTDAWFVSVSSVLFWRWLFSIGLTPNKSKTIGPLLIPKELFFDFLRGCFDGDGSVYSYLDPRWPRSFMFYVSFCSASKPFLLWLQALTYFFLQERGYISVGPRVFQLKFAKRASLAIIKRMYYNPRVPCLKRKYDKLNRIIKQNSKYR